MGFQFFRYYKEGEFIPSYIDNPDKELKEYRDNIKYNTMFHRVIKVEIFLTFNVSSKLLLNITLNRKKIFKNVR